MIFQDKLDERTKIFRPEIDRLLDKAWRNQAHIGDLLLFHINGFFQETILNHNLHSDTKLNPHTIGPGLEGHSESSHYSFIHKYRTTSISEKTHKEYLEQVKWVPEKRKQIDDLIEFEETTIQLEMLIYLKIWEADLFIKKLYQFVRALSGEPYNWYFKLSESSRDKTCTGTRQEIIRKLIIEKLKDMSPTLHQTIKETYKTQIRNSIAHSNYSFLGRNIHLNNFIKDDQHSQLSSISFDEWINIFHNTIIFHNEYLRMNNLINELYAKLALENGNTMEILITEADGTQYPAYVEYRPQWKDWKYKNLNNK